MEASWKDSFESPKGTYVHSMHQPQVTMLEDNAAVVTYYETVIINPPAVKEQTADQYRVTRVFQKIDGKWLIVHDHASALPMK